MGGSAGKNSLLNDEVINRIAKKHSISAAQVLLRWAIQRNYGEQFYGIKKKKNQMFNILNTY